ncbi:MAG: DNA polymerase III subunit delta [Actinobacteria bacterium]|jgi:DNA polymerase-3 subunit delta|nr:DNA polymerase III subunit delta [Actinomycetota bacterium]
MVENQVGLVLIQGPEALLADRVITNISSRFPNSQISNLYAGELEVGMITDSLAPSLFGDQRIVIIRDTQDLTAECTDEVLAYLEDEDSNLLLVLWHKGGVKGKGLVDKVKKLQPEVFSAETIKKDSEKAEFIRSEFRGFGRKITNEAVQALINSLGSDLRELGAACSQLASDVAREKTIDQDDVAKYQQGRVESTGFDVADAVVDGKTAEALISLRNALATGTDPVLIVSALASSFRTLAKVSGSSKSLSSYELASSLALPPWQIEKAKRQLSGWSESGLSRAVIALAALDADIKGVAADPKYALERALMTVTSARGTR